MRRELAVTRVMPGGSRRGTAAARATAYVRLATRQPSAAGKSQALSSTTADASTHERKARVASVVPRAQRLPWRNRSSSGPMSGASSTKGAMVSTRNSATRPRASSVGSAKTVPASETVSAASAATLTACSSVSRARPVSAAPSASAKRRNRRPAAAPPRPTNRMPARPPRPTRRPALRPAPATRRRAGGGGLASEVMTCRSSPDLAVAGQRTRPDVAPCGGQPPKSRSRSASRRPSYRACRTAARASFFSR